MKISLLIVSFSALISAAFADDSYFALRQQVAEAQAQAAAAQAQAAQNAAYIQAVQRQQQINATQQQVDAINAASSASGSSTRYIFIPKQ